MSILIGAGLGWFAFFIVWNAMFLRAEYIGQGQAFEKWLEEAPHIGGMSILGWTQGVFMLIGAFVAIAL